MTSGLDASMPAKPGFFKTWWIALRPFSFPASAMSVIFGTVLAMTMTTATFAVLKFTLALLGMVLLHGGANLLNDVYDFRKGIDQEIMPVSGAVVRQWITPREALWGAAICFAAGAVIGLVLVWLVGLPLLYIGLGGLAMGILYSASPLGLKYIALGDVAVFLDFGVLGSLGAWVVQTGQFSWLPVVWSIPLSLLVVGILHANNWRDIAGDRAGGSVTVATLLGEKRSLGYYGFLLFSPFVLVALFILLPLPASSGLPTMPLAFFITFLSLPLAGKLLGKARRRKQPEVAQSFLALDGATAQLNLLFGLLCTIALVLHAALGQGA